MKRNTDESLAGAIERLIELYGEDVYKVAYLYMKNQHSAEDVFQEVFYKVMKYYGKFQHQSSEKTWLIRITINTCKDILKQSWLKRVSTFAFETDYAREAKQPNNFIEKEQKRELYELISQLPPRYRDVILLFYYENITYEEMASILGIPKGTVQSRLTRGRQKLKRMLEERGDFNG